MSPLIRNGVRAVSLSVAAVLVATPIATSPVAGVADGVTALTAMASQQKIHERRELKLHSRMTRMQRNKVIAHAMLARHGWRNARQFRCLERLWTRESHWNERAHNGATGAHGIPQAMPGSKMGTAGPNWRTNPKTQIRWGLRYIKNRYGSPCGAWSHFRAAGWY